MMLVAAFVLLYEATVSDSRYGSRQAELLKGTLRPIPGTRLQFKATAYCKGHTTASGVAVRSGVAAADPEILPVGSVIQADFESNQYDGVYTIMDTGPEVQGNELDVYMWSCFDALRFGRQDVHLVVLRLGWNPKDTTPLMETLFHRRIPVRETRRRAAAAAASRASRDPNAFRTAASRRCRILRLRNLAWKSELRRSSSRRRISGLVLQLKQLVVDPAHREQPLVAARLAQLALCGTRESCPCPESSKDDGRSRASCGRTSARAARRESAARSPCRRSTSLRPESARTDRTRARAQTTAAASARPTTSRLVPRPRAS